MSCFRDNMHSFKLVANLYTKYLQNNIIKKCIDKSVDLCLDLSLPLFQQLGHYHRPVPPRALTAHGPLAQQGDHCVIVRTHLGKEFHTTCKHIFGVDLHNNYESDSDMILNRNCYLVPVFTLAWPEDSVVERVQRITKVRFLKAVVVQNLQCVQDSADCEACPKHHVSKHSSLALWTQIMPVFSLTFYVLQF